MTTPTPAIVHTEPAFICDCGCTVTATSAWCLGGRPVCCWQCAALLWSVWAQAEREASYDRNHPYGIGGY